MYQKYCTSSPGCDEDCCRCEAYAEEIANITDRDQREIGEQVVKGMTRGLFDRDGYRVSWELKTDVFKN